MTLKAFKFQIFGFLAVAALVSPSGIANAAKNLRMQAGYSESSSTGELIAQFARDVAVMSAGELTVEMYYSNSLVDHTFDAAANGIIDCDVTTASYLTGKDPGFQFAADLMGGYDTPLQQISYLYYGGGKETLNELYSQYGMTFVGWNIGGHESLSSTRPLGGIDDLKDFKFRSPPGMLTDIFATLGAKPVVMDFSEVFSALETGIVDGADASYLAINQSIGIYDIAKYATFPGFHSMSADHLACNRDVWQSLSDAERAIVETAWQKLAMQVVMRTELANRQAVRALKAKGVTFYDWSAADRASYRNQVRKIWAEWAGKSDAAARLIESHSLYLKEFGLADE